MSTQYHRILPRDLFNEAKLLKCLGQLSLMAHDRRIPGLTLKLLNASKGFNVRQDQDDGGLYCLNLLVKAHGCLIDLKSPYNSRDPWPLLYETPEDSFPVFDDEGQPTEEFLEAVAAFDVDNRADEG